VDIPPAILWTFYSAIDNPAYQELAEHYALVVLPARVRKPRDYPEVL